MYWRMAVRLGVRIGVGMMCPLGEQPPLVYDGHGV
jgi:hypothetical protein